MKSEHSPEPWRQCCDHCSAINDANGERILTVHALDDECDGTELLMKANKGRLLACVNACRGLSDKLLKDMTIEGVMKRVAQEQFRAAMFLTHCHGLNPEVVPELVGMLEKLIKSLDKAATMAGQREIYRGDLLQATELLGRVKG